MDLCPVNSTKEQATHKGTPMKEGSSENPTSKTHFDHLSFVSTASDP